MDARAAALRVLGEDRGSELHWTVIWDRALKAGYIDPFTQPGARDELLSALVDEARAGRIVKTSKGTYRLGTP
jgi:hypothetical protein